MMEEKAESEGSGGTVLIRGHKRSLWPNRTETQDQQTVV